MVGDETGYEPAHGTREKRRAVEDGEATGQLAFLVPAAHEEEDARLMRQ